jgi:hypothetical protein
VKVRQLLAFLPELLALLLSCCPFGQVEESRRTFKEGE